jgi:hypothetical protein
MKSRLGIIALVIGMMVSSSSFAADMQPNKPNVSAEKDSGTTFGEGLTGFKKMAGHPLATGTCDKKGDHFATNIVLYDFDGVQLFEITNSDKKFFFVRLGLEPEAFFEERGGEYKEIPLAEIYATLNVAGAQEFRKSIDPAAAESDCTAQRFE